MITKIDHVAIAVRSLATAIEVYSRALGFSEWLLEGVSEQKTRVAMHAIGDCRIELLEATAEDSPVALFIARRGEGLHHICFQVQNLDVELQRLRSAGLRLIDQTARAGAGGSRIAFLHPSSAAGVLIELAEPGTTIHSHINLD